MLASFRLVIAIIMAVVGSTIFDQTMFGKDIEENGEMHEYYDPETGKGVHNKGFQSWNLLVVNMIKWYRSRFNQ